MERIPAEGWEAHAGHVARYRYAAARTRPGETVNDVACGVGYGATFFGHAAIYRGYDKPGIPDRGFPGMFTGCDVDDPAWCPAPAEVTTCFETLEHVKDPAYLAVVLAETTRRAIFVSVPVVPTVHCNEFHVTDFTRADIPPLFPDFIVEDEWPQPDELSHVWMFARA